MAKPTQAEMFELPSSRPKKSKAWQWKAVSASSWELRDPRDPRDVYRIVVARTFSKTFPEVFVATGPNNFRGEFWTMPLAKKACRALAQRREGGRKAARTRASLPGAGEE